MPVLVANRSDLSAQSLLWIADEPKRKCALGVLPEGIMVLVRRLVELGITNDPFPQLPAVFGRLRADPENGDVVLLVSSVFVDKGRNLGPTPRSPLSAVKENDRSRCLLQHRWELYRFTIDILQGRCGKYRTDIQK